jgi:hypothetical protein
MPPLGSPLDVSTTYLGAYTWEHANEIAEKLEAAGIVWWYKQPGFLSQVWEFGAVRLFVDRERLEQAQAIADGIAPEGRPRKRGRPSGATG